ncbi:AAA family ATPase [Actinomadura opuntiae]|uniref:AAA family ATPase n=1 Tax=Actinomadura sp. OS1-43 TaxID=604315 RepID=UPI00255A9F6D|nr:AAA family ATPase [Actinomadura sp. OS1-43]MDL4813090.1 AAA family ATPase [Actinomadura sp. OS1-43]
MTATSPEPAQPGEHDGQDLAPDSQADEQADEQASEPVGDQAQASASASSSAPTTSTQTATAAAPPRNPQPTSARPARPATPARRRESDEIPQMMDKLQGYFGFSKTPFGRGLAPSMLHRHAAHQEAIARITWCVSDRALGVVTGEVGVGKTAAARAAVATLDPARHIPIYMGNPDVGVRGIHTAIVTALGGVPKNNKASLIPQASDMLATEQAERGRTPVLVLDEAHMLDHDQLESVRMLTLCRARDYADGRQGALATVFTRVR